MEWHCSLLAQVGYEIVWIAGDYCRACRDGRDVILRWTGESWLTM